VEENIEEWWECTNRMCGQKIQFVTLDKGANPTCFCGSSMKRPYVKPHYREFTNLDAVAAGRAANRSVLLFVAPFTMTCLLPRSDA
jgi:hypothetical protein